MSAHTPGPWHVTAGPYPREIRADDGPFIASVYDVAVTYGERNANARVLAAAPELLEALKAMLEELETAEVTLDQQFRCLGDPPRQPSAAVVAATTAIAKAEGR